MSGYCFLGIWGKFEYLYIVGDKVWWGVKLSINGDIEVNKVSVNIVIIVCVKK